ncbi:hypothetical protein GOP47_0006783 [Adiantum capillus-veneris]|uniref:Uncharacterized protein n=1 Tax=Adiantum capillus-veneris TaxID=13818 RepID=A0A9D4V4A2_ADICA|nr:hypothetical protein GOP47_0006783 [Adiantum capillus-veneris]
MASLKSQLHVFLPLSFVVFLLCSPTVEAAHRKLNLNKQLPSTNNRVLMSSSTFYNAFDTNNPNAFDATHTNFNHYASSKEGANVNYDKSANRLNDIANSELNANSYTDTRGNNAFRTNSYRNNANQPLDTSNNPQANGAQHSYPTTLGFSSPSSSNTPSPYYDQASLPDAGNGYGKQSFPWNDQQSFHGSQYDAKSFFYSSPSTVDTSLSKEQGLSQSSLNYETSYNPFHQMDELKSNNHAYEFGFKSEKPVTNYDGFFNSPTIHKNEAEVSTAATSSFGQQNFPLGDHDLTYGHVQVP